MDFVHQPQNHSWIGEKINLNEYFTKYQELVQSTRSASAKKGGDLKTLSAKNIKKLVETVQNPTKDKESGDTIDEAKETVLDDQLYDKIESLCDINNLTIPNEVCPMQQFLDFSSHSSRDTSKESKSQAIQYPKFQVKNMKVKRFKNLFPRVLILSLYEIPYLNEFNL